MPWTARDVSRHNSHVKSPKRKKQWRDVANSILKRTGDDARAIRGANSVVKKAQAKRAGKRR
jgi:uncharacterized protein YdaT